MKKLLFSIACMLSSFLSMAQLSLPDIFTDNMVFQREAPILIWGNADPGKTIKVKFSSEEKEVVTKPDATWQVEFQPQPANTSPKKLIITSGKNRLEIANILIGDVWLLSGQSNMEWPLKNEMHFSEEQNQLAGDKLRFFNPTYAGKGIFSAKFKKETLENLNPKDFYRGDWEVSGSKATGELSAIGYYFAKELISSEEIPIGLINLAIGGAPIEAFISKEFLREQPRFSEKVEGNWLENNQLPVWIRERGEQNVGNLKGNLKARGLTMDINPDLPMKPELNLLKNFPLPEYFGIREKATRRSWNGLRNMRLCKNSSLKTIGRSGINRNFHFTGYSCRL